ncbi:MAG: translation elongation factor Ts, partial [Planctomycetota bacterium]
FSADGTLLFAPENDIATGEGRIGVFIDGDKAAIVEIHAETDFTAKNEKFVDMTQNIAGATKDAGQGDVELPESAKGTLDEIRITTGENISYARGKSFQGGKFASYVHHDGKTGVLLQAEGDVDETVMKDVCMHIVAAVPVPQGVSPDDIPQDLVERERKFRLEQAMESGKPQEIAEKMVEGGMRKFFETIALVEQPFVKDPSTKIKDLVGSGGKLVHFERWVVGETTE